MSCYKTLSSLVKGNILVETGSGKGKGIQVALDSGATTVYSVEIDTERYSNCFNRFKSLIPTKVTLYHGDSINILPDILKQINSKAVFLLDAHIMDEKKTHSETMCPILKEIELVLEHGKKIGAKHVLIIDDKKLFNGKTKTFDNIKIDDIKSKILSYDSTYKIAVNRREIVAL